MKRRSEILSIALLVVIFACNERQVNTPVSTDKSPVRNMKGFEVYVWNDSGKTYYTLLPGTNRNKDSAEIYNKNMALEWNEMKAKIDNIDTGQYVFIKPLRTDAEKVSELREYLRSKKLVVSE
jgi:hypothetical protein